jgi:hypothetical protein
MRAVIRSGNPFENIRNLDAVSVGVAAISGTSAPPDMPPEHAG